MNSTNEKKVNETVQFPKDKIICLIGSKVDLFDMDRISKKSKYVAFLFFPMDSAVDLEAISKIDEELQKFKDLGCSVIGVCADNAFVLEKLKEKEVGFPIVCDTSYLYAKSFEIAKTDGLPSRATFIVEKESRNLKYSQVDYEKINVLDYLSILEELRNPEKTKVLSKVVH